MGVWPKMNHAFAKMSKVLLLFLCLLAIVEMAGTAEARNLEVLRIRTHSDLKHTRVVLDLNGAASYRVFRMPSSGDIAIRVVGAQWGYLSEMNVGGSLLQAINPHGYNQGAEVVLALSAPVKFKYFFLPAIDGASNRIVVDLFPLSGSGKEAKYSKSLLWKDDQVFTVIIDPGHGGLDSGAVRGKTLEKDVVLDIARRMQGILGRQPGFKVILTREKDNYPSLESRVALAEKHKGDLLISLHCNTHSSPGVRGTEVYCQSLVGANELKRNQLQNYSLAGVRGDADEDVARILWDIQMGQILKRSINLAEHILGRVADDAGLKRRNIRQGQYKVLESLSMPAALVEIAFLSNPGELEILSSSVGRQGFAEILASAVISWQADEKRYN